MVCSSCVLGASVCPKKTTVMQYDKYNLKGRDKKSAEKELYEFTYTRNKPTGCIYKFYKYRYFPQLCRELPRSAEKMEQAEPRITITGGLHAYETQTSILL
jgi:hypothetical protein